MTEDRVTYNETRGRRGSLTEGVADEIVFTGATVHLEMLDARLAHLRVTSPSREVSADIRAERVEKGRYELRVHVLEDRAVGGAS